jgi:hypothetical protein
MRRTTLVLEDDIARRIKERAALKGQTMKELVNALLRKSLSAAPSPQRKFRLQWKTYRGIIQPGVRLDDRDSLFDLMDEK